MKKLLLAFAMAVGLSPAAPAQTFSSSPEVGTYDAQPLRYPNVGAGEVPTLGNGQDAKGGTAPAFTTHPEPVDPTANENFAGWSGAAGANGYCLATNNPANGCNERKARFTANSCLSSFKRDDPIRYWGQPGVSHLHEFFVSCEVNAFSTYRSLRLKRNLPHVGPGGPIVGTGYWEPAWLKTVGGKVYAMPGTMNTIYYTKTIEPNKPVLDELQRLHLLFRFIGGVNMDDPDNTKEAAAIAAANAAIYASNPSKGASYWRARGHFAGYLCQNPLANNAWSDFVPVKHRDGTLGTTVNGTFSPHLYAEGFMLPDGSDPWMGQCGTGARIMAAGQAPNCWDGVNVSSPNGYDHVAYSIFSADGVYQDVCPMGWYKVPAFEIKAHHTTQGWNDYKTWRLASDAMMAARLGRSVMPGESFHFDWMNGWHKPTLDRWLSFCMGVGTNVPHDCNDSTIDDQMALITSAPAPDGSRAMQVDGSYNYNTNDLTKLHLVGDVRAEIIHAH